MTGTTPLRVACPALLGSLLLAACGGRAEATPESVTSAGGEIQVAVASSDFEVGQPRVPLVLYSGIDRVADAQAVRATAFDLASDPPAPGWSGEATNYSDYEIPYWVVYPELPHAGNWGLGLEVTLADGGVVPAEVVVAVLDDPGSPVVGERAPASHNRTLATEPDISMLSSDDDPNPDLYQMTVADALETGKPTVVTLATPRYCTSQMCAPVVDSVKAVHDEVGDRVNFIHIEIFKDFETLDYADEVEEWGLDSEPWTFVLDPEGVVTARLGGPVSPRELTEALEPLLG